ncbi:MAG TPA: hypothetical protein VGP73_22760, partial [Thermoanaerobaculia bacterium]
VTIYAGDDGLSTTGGGTTTLDLSLYPVQDIFGASVNGDPVVSLVGESLGPGPDLAGIDAVIRRPADIRIDSTGAGSGPISIAALRLVSEKPVSIGKDTYDLRVFLSQFRTTVQPGTVTFHFANGDGGTFDTTFYVRPRLVFTSTTTRSNTIIDCGAVTCNGGRDIVIQATSAPFVRTGGPGNFQPSSKGIKVLRAGLLVDGDGDGTPEVTTAGSSNLFVGITATSGFPAGPFPKYEFPVITRQTGHSPGPVTPDAVALVRPYPTDLPAGFN